MFASNGRRIARLRATPKRPYTPCGVLQNLALVGNLFASQPTPGTTWQYDDDGAIETLHQDDDELEVDDLLSPPPTYHLYPTAFLKSVGQWQANDVIDALKPHICAISRSVAAHEQGSAAIEPVKSQCYNNIHHYTRKSTKHHIAQRGLVSAAVGGGWATSAKEKNTAAKLYRACNVRSPHDELNGQLLRPDQTLLRFENVYLVHMGRVKPDYQSGDEFYRRIVFALASACHVYSVQTAITGTSIVLKENVSSRSERTTDF